MSDVALGNIIKERGERVREAWSDGKMISNVFLLRCSLSLTFSKRIMPLTSTEACGCTVALAVLCSRNSMLRLNVS